MKFSTRIPLILAGMVARHLETGNPIAEGFLENGVLYKIVTVSESNPDHIFNEWFACDTITGEVVASLQLVEFS